MTKTVLAGILASTAATAAMMTGAIAQPQPQASNSSSPTATPGKPPLDLSLLHVQVILDHLGFSPGILDGREGISLTAAIKGFQESRGMPITGKVDQTLLRALYPYRQLRPVKTIALTQDMLAGPYAPNIPKEEDQQAKLPGLYYRAPVEKLAEMFHTTPEVLQEMNAPGTRLTLGTRINFPNALPGARNYDPKLRPDWRATLNTLNVDSNQPQGAKIVVDKSDGVLRVLDKAGKLVAQFQVTTGSEHDPLPLGNWKVTVIDYNPKFHFNPDLFWDAKKSDDPAMLPAGPNGPVGVVWFDLTKEHYGIHGTPEPRTIGRTTSHGCVRLANWNAARLSLMVKPGVPVVFQA